MKIDFSSKTIEINKTFANKASHFGSAEFLELQTVTNELPDFCVVVKAARTPRRTYPKGMTYEFMESYISMADTDDSIMRDFQNLRKISNYATIKKWFMTVFPDSNVRAA